MGEENSQLNLSKGKSSGNVLVVFFRISIHLHGGEGVPWTPYITDLKRSWFLMVLMRHKYDEIVVNRGEEY